MAAAFRPHVGERVRLVFKGMGESEGRGQLSTCGRRDAALWHIVHDDGDEEDLEEQLQAALTRWRERPATACRI